MIRRPADFAAAIFPNNFKRIGPNLVNAGIHSVRKHLMYLLHGCGSSPAVKITHYEQDVIWLLVVMHGIHPVVS
jgi:hypothetical protein